jgi:hypothetical protein
VEALLEAADDAFELGANEEATGLLDHGLELLAAVPPDQRTDLEFELRLLRGTITSSTLGFSAPQAVVDFEACQALVEGVGSEGYLDDLDEKEARREYDLVSSSTGLWANMLLQGRIDDAERINQTIVARFRPGGESAAFVDSAGRSLTLFFRGEYGNALPVLERFLSLSGAFELPGRSPMPNDGRTGGLSHLSFVLSVQGKLEEARRRSDEGLDMAESFPFPIGPFTSCYVLGMRAAVELAHGYTEEANRAASIQAELAERHGFTFWSVVSGLYQATADFAAGDEAAAERATMIVSMLRAMGMLVWVPSFLGAISAVHLRNGDADRAAPLLSDAAEVAQQTGAHYWSAEITRQRGEVALATGDPAGTDLLREAVDLAVSQGAALHELWARTSLCRHLLDPSDREGLERLLATIPLPHDAPDRLAAQAVLAQAR